MKRVIGLLLITILLSACEKQVYTKTEMLMSTVVNITAISSNSEEVNGAFSKAFDEIKRIDALMGPYENSSVDKINAAPADTPVSIDSETYALIKRSIDFSVLSEGGFDITFASAGNLWNFDPEKFSVPSQNEIERALQYVGYKNLVLDDTSAVVTKAYDEVRVGLGGIAKGYIIDRAVEVMKESGIKSGIVDAGGDVRVFGKKNGKPWIVGVRHPRNNEQLLFTIKLKNGEACATSGDYERMIITEEKKRYHHIIDPRTGYPTTSFSSVTVITDNATDADGFATSFFAMGISHSLEYAARHDEIEVICIDRYMNTYISKSLKKKIEVLDDSLLIEWIQPYKNP